MSTPDNQVAHALLGASSAQRWLVCTPSVRLEEMLPDSTSEYAQEGTLAHEFCSLKLAEKFFPATSHKRALASLRKHDLYQKEMDRLADEYVEYIAGIAYSFPVQPYIAIEKRVSYAAYAQDGFGTADCIIIAGEDLFIIDYKHGQGVPVSAEDNPQMKCYALGAYDTYKMIYDIKRIHTTIFQPRISNTNKWSYGIDDLLLWAETVLSPAAKLAYAGEGEFKPSAATCQFCRAAGVCRARAEMNLDAIELPAPDMRLLTDEEIGATLKRTEDFAGWLKKLEAAALEKLLSGVDIPGWKAVEGRSNRTIVDYDATVKALKEKGYKPSVLYEKKPLTLTALEALVGKAELSATLGPLITKPQGKPTIAPATDKREPFKREGAADDFKDLKEANHE